MSRATKMNSITSPELLAQVNPKNRELLEDFLDYLKSVNRSDSTIFGYKNDIEIAWVWCLQHNDNSFYCDWTKRQIIKYQNWLLNENQNSPARIRRLKAVLSSLGNYVESVLDEEYPSFKNIINKIPSPTNQPVREKTVWADEDIEDLLKKLVDKKMYEKACMVALAVYSGRRKSELCRFKVRDFDQDHLVCDGALYKSDPIKTKGRGNGKFIPCYTLAKRFNPYLKLWMDERESRGIESEWLFPSASNPNEQISATTLNSWVRTFSSLCGRDVYMHSFRHAFTTNLVRAGIPESVITQIVGWESVDMCKIYTDIEADEQISMYFKDGDVSVQSRKDISDI